MSVTIKGPLLYSAENRRAADGSVVLILTVKTPRGWPYEARVPFGDDWRQAADYAAQLPSGTHVTIEAQGAQPRSDFGLAVLSLQGVERVDAGSFVVSGLLR